MKIGDLVKVIRNAKLVGIITRIGTPRPFNAALQTIERGYSAVVDASGELTVPWYEVLLTNDIARARALEFWHGELEVISENR